MSSWDAPLSKFRERVRQIKALQLGPGLAAYLFNTYAVPVLQYVAQLLPSPPCLVDAAKSAVTSLLGVPFTALGAHGPYRLGDAGGPKFQSPIVSTLAARIRAARRIFGPHDFIVAHLRAVAVEFLSLGEGRRLSAPSFWDRTSVADYIANAFVGLPMQPLVHEFVAPILVDRPALRSARRVGLQSQLTEALHYVVHPCDMINTCTSKLSRMVGSAFRSELSIRKVERALKFATAQSAFTATCTLKLFCNAWCTGSHFGESLPCIFGCRAADSLRHYIWCVPLWRSAYLALNSHGIPALLTRLAIDDPSPLSSRGVVLVHLMFHTAKFSEADFLDDTAMLELARQCLSRLN